MFEGIKRNINHVRRRLRGLDVGETQDKAHHARVLKNRRKKARRQFLDARDEAMKEWEKLIADGRDRDDDHVLNVHHRMIKADHWADVMGEQRENQADRYRNLKQVFKRKTKIRKDLLRELKEKRHNLREAREKFEREQAQKPPSSGVGTYDGKPIAAWMIPTMNYARSHGWNGTLTSGYRSPEYSQQLCYQICGAPVCPGRCAGTTSNHTKNVKPAGAVDVSDPAGFARAQNTLRNALGAADPWHYSVSGG